MFNIPDIYVAKSSEIILIREQTKKDSILLSLFLCFDNLGFVNYRTAFSVVIIGVITPPPTLVWLSKISLTSGKAMVV